MKNAIKRITNKIVWWFKYRMNKQHLELVKESFVGYPFDHAYLTRIEEYKLKEMLEYHKNRSVVPLEDGTRNEIVSSLELACKLIHMINNEDELYDYDGDDNVAMFVKKDGDDNLYELNPERNMTYVCNVKVNTNNASRFCRKDQIQIYTKYKHELYLLKVKHVYYMLREMYTDLWWD